MSLEPVVPISALEHHVYCPRQCALVHVDGLWVESEHTARGDLGHRRVDSGAHRVERGRLVLRSVPLWSETFGLTGRADAIEVHRDRSLVPVEYKIGGRHGDAAHIQLCAQALCLEEMTGQHVEHGYVWFSSPRRRADVAFDANLRDRTRTIVDEVRAWLKADGLPPAADDTRCRSCQLLDVCQPSLTAHPRRVLDHLSELFACDS